MILNKYYEKINNRRSDYIHKITKELVNENQVIVTESLNIIKMMKDRRFTKNISSVSWGELFRQLKYKCNWNGRIFHQIDRFFPSSKTCNNCGNILQVLKLEDREWICPKCGVILDRDINAAINILKQGENDLKNLGLGAKSKYK